VIYVHNFGWKILKGRCQLECQGIGGRILQRILNRVGHCELDIPDRGQWQALLTTAMYLQVP
jgi:hypothetical protein